MGVEHVGFGLAHFQTHLFAQPHQLFLGVQDGLLQAGDFGVGVGRGDGAIVHHEFFLVQEHTRPQV